MVMISPMRFLSQPSFAALTLAFSVFGTGLFYAIPSKGSAATNPSAGASAQQRSLTVPKPEPEVTFDELRVYCEETYQTKLECPSEVCVAYFAEQKGTDAFIMKCKPKSCLNLPVDQCPLDTCRVMMGCDDVYICYPPDDRQPPQCGGLAYDGQDVPCCEGLVKRCGVEYFDGSCDMSGKHSIYAVPACIPCGNGICNQFENRCNCPEDCR